MVARRLSFSLLALVIIVTTALTSWWLIGDLTETDPVDADYLFRQPKFLTAHERTIGGISLITLLIGIAVAIVMCRRARPRLEWGILLTIWMLAAVAAGFAERALTVGVIGANIGGGMLILASPVAAILLIGISIWLLARLRRDESPVARRSFEPFDTVS